MHIAKSNEYSFPRKIVAISGRAVDDLVSEYAPYRSRGRPRPRWDDLITQFCQLHLDQYAHWLDALIAVGGGASDFEQRFMRHVSV